MVCLEQSRCLRQHNRLCMAINGWDSATAISELRQYMGGRIPTPHSHPLPDPPKKEPSPFVLPLKNSSHSRLKAYLCKTRGLDPRIVSELLKQEAIYQDSRNNVVFVGEIMITKRNTHRFVGLYLIFSSGAM